MRFHARHLLCLLVLAACAGPDTDLPMVEQGSNEPYRLDSGDQLRVLVYGDEQVSGDYTVDSAGFISMPLIHRVDARGRTPEELEAQIRDRLADGFLLDPSVNVQLQALRPFYILGEVKQPGQYACVDGMTVLSAAAVAGGFTYRARTDYVLITRRADGKLIEGRADGSSIIRPGDVIYVYERYF